MFWNQFYDLCTTNNTTPNAVCAKLGLSTATATHWKNGAIPKGDALSKLADYFNVSVDYLLGRDDSLGTKKIRQRVKKIADTYDLPIKNIENVLGTNYATFRAWCNGYGDYFNNITTFIKISQLFDVSTDYLLGHEASIQREDLSTENMELINKYILLTPKAQKKVNEYIEDLACNPTYTVNEITVDEIQRAIDERNKAAQNELQIAAHGGDGVRVMKLEDFSDDMIDELIKDNERRHQE